MKYFFRFGRTGIHAFLTVSVICEKVSVMPLDNSCKILDIISVCASLNSFYYPTSLINSCEFLTICGRILDEFCFNIPKSVFKILDC